MNDQHDPDPVLQSVIATAVPLIDGLLAPRQPMRWGTLTQPRGLADLAGTLRPESVHEAIEILLAVRRIVDEHLTILGQSAPEVLGGREPR